MMPNITDKRKSHIGDCHLQSLYTVGGALITALLDFVDKEMQQNLICSYLYIQFRPPPPRAHQTRGGARVWGLRLSFGFSQHMSSASMKGNNYQQYKLI